MTYNFADLVSKKEAKSTKKDDKKNLGLPSRSITLRSAMLALSSLTFPKA